MTQDELIAEARAALKCVQGQMALRWGGMRAIRTDEAPMLAYGILCVLLARELRESDVTETAQQEAEQMVGAQEAGQDE